jgi:outer membrane protein assembly factor BamB
VLWKRTFDDLGTFGIYYDETYVPDPLDTTYNQTHIAGANARGTNYVASDDGVYLVIGGQCLVLDPATGKTLRKLELPPEGDPPESPTWGYIGVTDGLVVAGSRMIRFSDAPETAPPGAAAQSTPWENFDTSSSAALVVMDSATGRVLWTREADHAFRHSAIAVGNGKLYCIDNLPHPVRYRLMLRGQEPKARPRLMCLDLRTGDLIWETSENVFGTWLSHSADHDVLLQSGRASIDMISGEPSERMIVYRAADGGVVWDKPIRHQGPCILHGETIFLNTEASVGGAVGLLTGEPRMRTHPLTGRTIPWQYRRRYGCNSIIASHHLLTFRSGAAGYYDLETESGTGNLGGFKSGCTANLIAADGVLNAPDYTRTCTCAYQNQTSLALVHNPDVEVWTFEQFDPPAPPTAVAGGATDVEADGAGDADVEPADRIRRLGLNFGAPGDRVGPTGTLWLDWPIVGGPSPNIQVAAEPLEAPAERGRRRAARQTPGVFAGARLCFHSSRIQQADTPWIAASGIAGATQIVIRLAEGSIVTDPETGRRSVLPNSPPGEATYTVRLHFAELQNRLPGERVFDVTVQGRTVLEALDIVREAGGPWREVVREVTGVLAADTLTVAFTARSGESLICGMELVQEEPDTP